uniref:Uncharacterized protein n=1 Tax=Anguilla anguilla TaxID=7936 RepID=A0A0E9S521_ANGAN
MGEKFSHNPSGCFLKLLNWSSLHVVKCQPPLRLLC